MKFIPLNQNVLCKRLGADEIKTGSGIILNSEIKEGNELVRGGIVAISEFNEPELKIGSIIYFQRNKADAIQLENKDNDYFIVKFSDLACIEE